MNLFSPRARMLYAALLATAVAAVSGRIAAQAAELSGGWTGAIETPAGELEIDVRLERTDDGEWSGSIDIPAQGVRDYQLSDIRVEGRRVRFAMAGVPGDPRFDGEVDEDGERIEGTFTQGPQTLDFTLRRVEGDGDGEEEDAAAAAPPPEGVPGKGIVGEWLGTLQAGPNRLRLVLRVDSTDGSGLRARLESVDQGADMPVDALAYDGSELRFSIDAIDGSFEGTMNVDGSAIEGTWSQAGQSLSLTFRRLAEPFRLNRPQEPQGPFPYDRREVAFGNDAAGISLAGTFLVPDGDGPFPAVLLVSGSGPQDRDESIMGHRPFLVIADHLARHGVASLRYDDRGVGESEGDHFGSTVQEFAADAEAGVRHLARRSEVDRDAVGILGHSEGGLTAAMVAAAGAPVDFLVLLAPPGVPLNELISRQTRDVLELRGVDRELIERVVSNQEEELEMVADAGWEREELADTLRSRARSQRERLPEAARRALQMTEASAEQAVRQVTSPWFRSLIREDPADHLGRVELPVLALFGEKDVQVAAEENARAVEAALESADDPDYEVRVLPGVNHLFQRAGTGAVDEYATIEETIAPEALERIRTWITERFAKPD